MSAIKLDRGGEQRTELLPEERCRIDENTFAACSGLLCRKNVSLCEITHIHSQALGVGKVLVTIIANDEAIVNFLHGSVG